MAGSFRGTDGYFFVSFFQSAKNTQPRYEYCSKDGRTGCTEKWHPCRLNNSSKKNDRFCIANYLQSAEKQFAAALKKELLIQDAARDERGDEFPVRRHHPVRCVLFGSRRAQFRQFVERLRPEGCSKPSPCLPQPRLPPHLVQLQQQFRVLMRRRRSHSSSHVISRHECPQVRV